MAKRKNLSASMRWQVFARDNFTCRYCGVQAGQDGVVLQADHVVSVAEGGDNSVDNLITACQRCNGGKGAKSLTSLPNAVALQERMADRARSIALQSEAIKTALESEGLLRQQAVNLKCKAYEIDSCTIEKHEDKIIINLCNEFGAETVLNWYRTAAIKKCPEYRAVKYVCGIARNVRDQAGDAHA